MNTAYHPIDSRLDAARRRERSAPRRTQLDFRHRLLLSWLFHDLAIEGVAATHRDLDRGLSGHKGLDYCDSVLLAKVRRLRQAIELVEVSADRRDPVNMDLLREYHQVLSGGVVDDLFRTEEGPTGQYKHPCAEPFEIESRLTAALEEVGATVWSQHPILTAVRFHYALVRVWPFNQHSATIARLVANQILLAHEYPAVIVPAHDRHRYYQSFHYDVSRLHQLTLDTLLGRVELAERLFTAPPRGSDEHRAA